MQEVATVFCLPSFILHPRPFTLRRTCGAPEQRLNLCDRLIVGPAGIPLWIGQNDEPKLFLEMIQYDRFVTQEQVQVREMQVVTSPGRQPSPVLIGVKTDEPDSSPDERRKSRKPHGPVGAEEFLKDPERIALKVLDPLLALKLNLIPLGSESAERLPHDQTEAAGHRMASGRFEKNMGGFELERFKETTGVRL